MKIKQLKGKFNSHLSGFLRAGLVGALVLLQFSVIIALSLWLRSYTVYFYLILEVLSLFVVITLINDNRSPSYKIAWVCIVLLLPISGHVMYALWGKSTANKKLSNVIKAKIERGNTFHTYEEHILEEIREDYKEIERVSNYMVSEGFPMFKNNQITYYAMGEDTFDAMFDDIRKAKHFILIEFFIVAEGGLWDELHSILLDKIKEGVEVKFLYDDFGAMIRTPKNFRRILENEGIQVRVFNPIHKYTDKLYMNYRSHQKIVVIDGNIGYTGGMNIADEYANLIERFGVWKDSAVRVYGDAVWGLTVTFLEMWEIASSGEYLDYTIYKPTDVFEKNQTFACVVADGPVNNPSNPIENTYKQIIYSANDYLYITTPYLILEEDMRLALIMAARSGVDVRIITPFIPDKKHVKILTNYNYGVLLQNGIRIYEYTPGFIHAKSIINENCGIVGTINMDYRSFYLHYECGVFMSEAKIIADIKADFMKTLKVSKEISFEEWNRRPAALKLYQSILNIFSTQM
ncbi:cardiolipin synthase [Anaerosporobacter faecicola]|uniref:cardiolipin synthase n=1 Tax=Anaerosporobacter faecicola TaxID=2718714 RepID=UPI00143C8CF2|nr:cardiolipin synthase [Anaerosporobacter faecicola]